MAYLAPAEFVTKRVDAGESKLLMFTKQPDPSKRQEVVSELVGDLRNPAAQFLRQRSPPLMARNPVVFWQATTAWLALVVLGLLARLAGL